MYEALREKNEEWKVVKSKNHFITRNAIVQLHQANLRFCTCHFALFSLAFWQNSEDTSLGIHQIGYVNEYYFFRSWNNVAALMFNADIENANQIRDISRSALI